eukprot:CAMPEP_0195136818 /NCGR_PEP_ID=MMETSP0448-20130528/154901_1 /TAXON_ID=66468 /ORGANISM="Heterocapsa triquestra, Strain CCMP 448" /LENGTH=118 /DNA_ID=CAMNT_0040175021 /DNA_START=95 /DNA_END=447 /DNA_ORIENTATION=+
MDMPLSQAKLLVPVKVVRAPEHSVPHAAADRAAQRADSREQLRVDPLAVLQRVEDPVAIGPLQSPRVGLGDGETGHVHREPRDAAHVPGDLKLQVVHSMLTNALRATALHDAPRIQGR